MFIFHIIMFTTYMCCPKMFAALFSSTGNLFTLERLWNRRLNCLPAGCQHLLLVLFDALHQQLAYRNRFRKKTGYPGYRCIPGQLHHGKQQAIYGVAIYDWTYCFKGLLTIANQIGQMNTNDS